MATFEAYFLEVHGPEDEELLRMRNLAAGSLEEAMREAMACERPDGTDRIDIYQEGKKVQAIGIGS